MSNYASNDLLNVRVYVDMDNATIYITNNFFYDDKIIYPDAVIKASKRDILERYFSQRLNPDNIITDFSFDLATKSVDVTDSITLIKNERTVKDVAKLLMSLSKRATKIAIEVVSIQF